MPEASHVYRKRSNKYPTSERSHITGLISETAVRTFDSAGVAFNSYY